MNDILSALHQRLKRLESALTMDAAERRETQEQYQKRQTHEQYLTLLEKYPWLQRLPEPDHIFEYQGINVKWYATAVKISIRDDDGSFKQVCYGRKIYNLLAPDQISAMTDTLLTDITTTPVPMHNFFRYFDFILPPETPYTRRSTWMKNQRLMNKRADDAAFESFNNRDGIIKIQWLRDTILRYEPKHSIEYYCPSAWDDGYCYKWHNYHKKWIADRIQYIGDDGHMWGEDVAQPPAI
jgi:hypothetical protein